VNATEVREYFERVAGDWDEMRLAWYDERVIDELAAHTDPSGSSVVLDDNDTVDAAVANMVLHHTTPTSGSGSARTKFPPANRPRQTNRPNRAARQSKPGPAWRGALHMASQRFRQRAKQVRQNRACASCSARLQIGIF
jgi:hypothetical protein